MGWRAGCCCYPYRWRGFAGAGLVLLVGRSGGYPIRFGPCRRGDPLPIGAAVVLIGGVVLVHRADGGADSGRRRGRSILYGGYGMPRCCRRWRCPAAGAGAVLPLVPGSHAAGGTPGRLHSSTGHSSRRNGSSWSRSRAGGSILI